MRRAVSKLIGGEVQRLEALLAVDLVRFADLVHRAIEPRVAARR